jgi:PAS domain S-box-containing protein
LPSSDARQEGTNVQTVEGNVTRFERLGLEDGLSQGCVNAILQDSQGFLWIGTQDGLNKYDGYSFTVYRHDPTDPASLSGNTIYAILEDTAGDLWLGTPQGLDRFEKRSNQFTRYRVDSQKQPMLDQVQARAILEDSYGMLWIGTRGRGLFRLDRQTGRLNAYQHDTSDTGCLGSSIVTALLQDARGTLWVGTHGDGLCRLDRRGNTFTHHCHKEDAPDSLSNNNITALWEDAQGTLWVGTETGGLNALDTRRDTPAFIRYQHDSGNPSSLSHDHVTTLLEDTAGTLWVGTGRGLCELDRRTNCFRRHYHQEGDPSSVSYSEILSLAEDAQGILWIGTRLGLNKFDRSTRAFGHFRTGDARQGGLRSNAVTSFLEDAQGYLWIGTYGGGLHRSTTFDTLDGFLHFDHSADDAHCLADRHALPDAESPRELGENGILAMCEDAQGRLWFGTNAGLHRLVPGDDAASAPTFVRYQHHLGDPSSLSHNLIVALAEDTNGDLWIGTYRGLDRLQADATRGFVHYLHDENDPHSLSHDFVRSIHIDSAGNIWIGTNGGLNRVVPGEETRFVRYQHDEQDPHSLSHDAVQCVAEDAQGHLWIGTRGGLNCFDPETGLFVSYREEDGLSNDVVYGVLIDGSGCLWLSTNRGINRFDPATERFTHYDIHDGVQANEFADGSYYQDRAGRLYFGGLSGFNVFHPDDVQQNPYLPPVVLTNFLLANQPVPIDAGGPLSGQIAFVEQIELAPEDYIFAFEFSALNYRQPHKNHYAYQLEGFDRDWIYADARDRKAVYTNVPPGTYTLRVKAANDDGLWNEQGTSIQVAVSQPWWHIVFGSAFEAVVIHGQGKILQVNQAAVELYGYQQDELIGESMYMLVAPEFRDFVERRVSEGDETPYEAEGLRKDGSAFVSEVRARAIRYQDRVVRVTAIRDITDHKRAEEALRQSQEFLQGALDSLSAHIAILDSEGTIVTVNASWRRFADENGLAWEDYGVGRSYLLAAGAGSETDVTGTNEGAAGIRDVISGRREQFWMQYPCHSPEEGRWFEMRVTRFESPQGTRVAVSHENITERIKALHALQQSEAKFRGFVEQSADGILVVNEDGAVIEWNPSLEKITGLTRQEVLGVPAWEVQYRLAPDEQRDAKLRERTKAAMLGALRTGEASWLEETVQATYRRADGATRHVEQRLFPIQTDYGFRIGGVSADVTERREAEAQLRTLSRAVEQSDSTILVTNPDGIIEFVNPAFSRITGYTAEEAMGQNPRILKSGRMPQEIYADLWGTITQGQVWEGELLNKRKDGSLYWESAIISPVRDSAGTTTHFVAVKQDITARKEAEQALERRVQHERALAACSQTLLRTGDVLPSNTALLNEALGYLMDAVRASRAYVFRNFWDPEAGFCSGIVAEAVVPGQPQNLENSFSQRIPWSSAPRQNRLTLQAGQPCGGPTGELFASTPELMARLLDMGILSVQFFPIHFGDEWWGYVGFDDCETAREWDAEEIVVLRTASQMIGSALQRWQAEAALREAHDELEQRVQARTAELNDAVERLRQEVDQRQRAEAETRERLVVQQTLAAISTHLMQAADFEDAVTEALAQTGALLDARRVFLVRLQSDGQTVHRVHEWCAPGVVPIFRSSRSWNLAEASAWLDELREQGWFYAKHGAQTPPDDRESIVPLFRSGDDGARCAIPVYARQEMIGFLGCHGLVSADQGFDQHLQVLEVVVGILSSAWLRERVLETMDERIAARTRELSTFFDLTTLAIGAQDLSEMLGPVPGRILELGSCDAMCIHLLDAERTTLTLVAHGNLAHKMREQVQAVALDSRFLRRMKRLGEPLLVRGQSAPTPLPDQLRLEEFPSYYGVPLSVGWIGYYRASPYGFSLDESSLLLAVAEQIGVSVENYRLRQRIGEVAVLEERQRLARDLHDSVTQSLYLLALYAGGGRDAAQDGDIERAIDILTELESNALHALREMRLLLYELRPEALEQEGLVRTLERRFDAVERRAGTDAKVIYQAEDDLELPNALERELYYLAMEALNNTLKHAGATAITIRIDFGRSELRMEISDDGCGFDVQKVKPGLGLHDMEERTERLGGRLEIASEPGAGTTIGVWLDLSAR